MTIGRRLRLLELLGAEQRVYAGREVIPLAPGEQPAPGEIVLSLQIPPPPGVAARDALAARDTDPSSKGPDS